jgi:hypothetical protein
MNKVNVTYNQLINYKIYTLPVNKVFIGLVEFFKACLASTV